MKESLALKLGHLALVGAGSRVWRNNVGNFVQGDVTRLVDGSIHIKNPRWIVCGLAEGSSDLIGGTPIIITPAMVGRTVFVFTAAEAKNEVGNTTKLQRQWLDMVNACGGIGFAFRSETQAREELQAAIRRITCPQ